ncbi:cyclin-dependent kinase 2-associated protein 1 [Neocloeon triangulifer]|uniref:cyclin-dependent kinase 2-associated protein 1 n=1 Tax=Neocloeon triangulifer TaxID=2078957 RepID=UPI00286F6C05|nr:cyclin-dependent kinase 2-associated protein 1 [Neocloeon triangulifer]XP_059475567.1 cyclin-dependent kinase 2-associated protein 1 [Neocloeon triangulifer]
MDDELPARIASMEPSVTITPIPANMPPTPPTSFIESNTMASITVVPPQQPSMSKYAQLLAVIEEMGKDLRPTYAGSKTAAERLKRGIVHSRILVRECLMETERSARQ